MSLGPVVAKYMALALFGVGVFLGVYLIGRDPSSLVNRYFSLYCASLDRKLRNMFITTRGLHIAFGQIVALLAVAAAGLSFSIPYWFLLLPLIALAPALHIEQLRRDRLKRIESKVDGFMLTLANALKSTPSIGNALSYAESLVAAPLDQELGLTLKEMRVGTTVDQALLNMAARIQSPQLDAALAGILIGRQVGGDLPRILETTADTLREIARLQGVVKAKTAEGKAQIYVLAVFPALLLVVFDMASPGYFTPLTSGLVGWFVTGVAILCWIASLVMARSVLMVDI